MALADYLNVEFAVMDKTTKPDPMGGILTVYQEGAHFRAGLVANTTTEMRIAQQNGAKSLYTLVVDKRIVLERGDMIRRLSDKADFRLLSATRDMTTPPKAGIQCSQATLERVDV
jgi:hypothetical protein